MKYVILYGDLYGELADKVSKHLTAGWILHGAPYCSSSGMVHYQAMTKG